MAILAQMSADVDHCKVCEGVRRPCGPAELGRCISQMF
jgi:hypothetical protein